MQYEVGDTITYIAFGGERRTVVVTERDEDIKNGYPGFDAMLPNGGCVWGYDDQIIQVERKA